AWKASFSRMSTRELRKFVREQSFAIRSLRADAQGVPFRLNQDYEERIAALRSSRRLAAEALYNAEANWLGFVHRWYSQLLGLFSGTIKSEAKPTGDSAPPSNHTTSKKRTSDSAGRFHIYSVPLDY
ncbi:MAG: hypothetical protein KDD42_09985, partial [Bdellovibrionales bacterium]|nr:hypothetical protein [Bdellovibrionales bacterium]